MGLKPLYLGTGPAWRVAHDGPALRVQALGRAPAWYPYRRLARVVSATDAQWQAAALIACLRAGVPVCFIDGRGEPQGYCYGASRRETTLDGLLAFALDSPEWELRFHHWRRGQVRGLVLDALRVAGLPPRDLDVAAVRSALCNALHRHLGQPISPLLRHLDGALHAFAAERLHRQISPATLGHPRPGLCLVDEFAALLHWPAHALLATLETGDLRDMPPAQLAASLLAGTDSIDDALAALLARFELWLRSWAL